MCRLFLLYVESLCYDHAVDEVFPMIQLFQRRDRVQRHAALWEIAVLRPHICVDAKKSGKPLK